jgi:hypothetical protein
MIDDSNIDELANGLPDKHPWDLASDIGLIKPANDQNETAKMSGGSKTSAKKWSKTTKAKAETTRKPSKPKKQAAAKTKAKKSRKR